MLYSPLTKYTTIVLGSKVMNEGITLENVAEVHIMDVYYNLGKVHQVIGRALRECKHYKIKPVLILLMG